MSVQRDRRPGARDEGGQVPPTITGLDRFGESAPGGLLFKHFGFTVEHVVATVRQVI